MKDGMRKIQDVPVNELKGKHVLLRIDTNVAIKNSRVLEDFRLKKSMPTISFLQNNGARIILIGHLESEDSASASVSASNSAPVAASAPAGNGKVLEKPSLQPIFNYLKNYFPLRFVQSSTVVDERVGQVVRDMKDGDIILLENLRFNPGEKKNSPEFAQALAALCELYVDDAFSVAHRAHASIVGIPAFLPAGSSYAGQLFQDEVEKLSECFKPEHPFLFILGGAKFDTKFPLVQKFLDIADHVFIGGALANDCFVQKGWNIGASTVSKIPVDGKMCDIQSIVNNPKIVLPTDVVVQDVTQNAPQGTDKNTAIKLPSEIKDNDKILDAGPQSIESLRRLIAEAKFILWNGPLGQYEAGFREPTIKLAKIIAEKSVSAKTVLGGGDTLAVISELNIENKFYFVSSAGGAMLDFLANGTLPGIKVLER
jgi:phosphoglycerate kinase